MLLCIAIIYIIYQLSKESHTPNIPSENWRNMELYRKDLQTHDVKTCLKWVEQGKYK